MSGRMACLFFAGVVLAACTPEESARGFIPAPDDIKAIVVGTDTKETVQKRLGNPTTAAEFGDDTWYYMSIYQSQTGFQLPKDVQQIIVEVAKEFEARTGTVNKENYPKQLEQLKGLGTNIKSVPPSVKQDWANSLKDWPQQKAAELDKQGLPASQVLKLALEEAEKLGHKWPVRYAVK